MNTATLARVSGGALMACLWVAPVLAQGVDEYRVLRINEVVADNRTQGPEDIGGGRPDLVEIFNTGDLPLTLGFGSKESSLALSDTAEQPTDEELWTFPDGLVVRGGKSSIIFCDGNICQNDCEPHATFQIASDGTEPITLWGPADGEGKREIIDQVYLPPLREDVSFGRDEKSGGPAPVPVEVTFDHFRFYPASRTSLGTSCSDLIAECFCQGTLNKRFCEGQVNSAATDNLEPRVSRVEHSTHAPEAGEAVRFVVAVRDDKVPVPPNIASVEIVYRVDEGAEQFVELSYDADTGVLPELEGLQPGDVGFPSAPLDRRTLWTGEIPGQPAGSRVRFFFRVSDQEGLTSTRPRVLCDFGVGPCGRNFGGDGCQLDPESTACRNPDFDPNEDPPDTDPEFLFEGIRYFACNDWFSYAVAYRPRPELMGLVVNEVVPSQTMLDRDPSATDSELCGGVDIPDYCCPEGSAPTCGYDDFVEIYNASDRTISLAGLWLSDSYFHPKGWPFPQDAVLDPDTYAIVWMDDDGSKCPDPSRDPRPCFYECPDPNRPAANEYHATFELNADGDQIFIYDGEDEGFGLIHGVAFSDVVTDMSLSLCPSGDRQGTFRVTDEATPRASNATAAVCAAVFFKRGDATDDCTVDLTDAVFTLNWLFVGGSAPGCRDAADSDDNGTVELTDAVRTLNWLFLGGATPPTPGPLAAGSDPSADDLPPCVYDQSCR